MLPSCRSRRLESGAQNGMPTVKKFRGNGRAELKIGQVKMHVEDAHHPRDRTIYSRESKTLSGVRSHSASRKASRPAGRFVCMQPETRILIR
jgi:hypothetical protein